MSTGEDAHEHDAAKEEEGDELDQLLQQYEQQAAADLASVRQRSREQAQRQQQQWRPGAKRAKTSAAAERREAALSQPIAPDNKGFQLLAAMGYKQGQGLGRSVQGRAEPIPLALKQDRAGLGAISKKAAAREQQCAREAKAAEAAAQRAAAAEAAAVAGAGTYQQRAAAAAAARQAEGRLHKALRTCEALDTAAGVAGGHVWSSGSKGGVGVEGWDPGQLPEGPAAAAAASAAGSSEAQGKDADTGVEGDAHAPPWQQQQEEEDEEQAQQQLEEAEEEARERWEALPTAEKLQLVLSHLRERYWYCLYCGCRYDDAADMAEHCPGPDEADHD